MRLNPEEIQCTRCRSAAWIIFTVTMIVAGLILGWASSMFSPAGIANYLKLNTTDILKIWIPVGIAIWVYSAGEKSKQRDRTQKAKLDTYLGIWGDLAKVSVMIVRTPDMDKTALANTMELFSMGWSKVLLIAPEGLQLQIQGVGRFIRQNYIPLLRRRLAVIERGEALPVESHFDFCAACNEVSTGLRRRAVAIAKEMRRELGTSLQSEKFEEHLLAEISDAETELQELLGVMQRDSKLCYIWSIIGPAVSPEIILDDGKISVILSEGGYAIVNPNRDSDLCLFNYHLLLPGDAIQTRTGEVIIGKWPKDSDEKFRWLLIIQPIASLHQTILDPLRERRPWLPFTQGCVSEWDRELLSQIPNAYRNSRSSH